MPNNRQNNSRVVEYSFDEHADAPTRRLDDYDPPRNSRPQQPRTHARPNGSASATANPRHTKPANRPSPGADASYRHIVANRKKEARKRTFVFAGFAGAIALVACIVVGIASLGPVNVTVNGTEVSVGGSKTVQDAFAASSVEVQPGDYVAVDGSILEGGAGEAFSATVNGNEAGKSQSLKDGDVVEFSRGHDIEEPYTGVDEVIPYGVKVEGIGAVHLVSQHGEDGVKTTKTGTQSGITAQVVTKAPVDITCRKLNVDTGGDKVIALTFDDGPNSVYTTQVLDILKEYGAKATFFTVGDRITGDNVGVLKRVAAEGHQISTHSFDHAGGSGQGVNLGYMSPEEQVAEITKGYDAIKAATGQEANTIIRTPGGNFGENVIANLSPYITSEIGWNIDTQDWQKPGAGVIAARIASAGPGDIVLMHDGGGDRSQTVAGLRDALPQLAAEGYRFVTVEELLEYVK